MSRHCITPYEIENMIRHAPGLGYRSTVLKAARCVVERICTGNSADRGRSGKRRVIDRICGRLSLREAVDMVVERSRNDPNNYISVSDAYSLFLDSNGRNTLEIVAHYDEYLHRMRVLAEKLKAQIAAPLAQETADVAF